MRYKPYTPKPVELTAEPEVPATQSGFLYKTESVDVVPEYTVSPRLRPAMADATPKKDEHSHVNYPNFVPKYDPKPAHTEERTTEPEYQGSPRVSQIHLRKIQPDQAAQEDRSEYSYLKQGNSREPKSQHNIPNEPLQIENQLDNLQSLRQRLEPMADEVPLPMQEPEYQGSPRLRPLQLSRSEPEAQKLSQPEKEDDSRYNYWQNSNTRTYNAEQLGQAMPPVPTGSAENSAHANFPNFIHKLDQKPSEGLENQAQEPEQLIQEPEYQGSPKLRAVTGLARDSAVLQRGQSAESAQYRPNPKHPQQVKVKD